MILIRPSFSLSLICFITIARVASLEIFAIDEGKINQEGAGKDWVKQLEAIVFKQNDRLALLEKQNGNREDENRLLNAELSKHKNEIDKINGLLLKANIRNESPIAQASTGDISRVKRPAQRLPSSLINNEETNATDESNPTGCKDLNDLGHATNGIYLVKKKENRKVEAVYCNFKPPTGSVPSERSLGYLDIKSASGVYFHVQMSGDGQNKQKRWTSMNGVMRYFNIERMNIGKAMNMSTGVFKAPKSGMYYLFVSLIKGQEHPQLIVHIRVNGQNLADARVWSQASAMAFASTQASIKLKKGDKVDLYKVEGILEKGTYGHTFMGWLVEEDFEE